MNAKDALAGFKIKKDLGRTVAFTNGNENTPTVSIVASNRFSRQLERSLRFNQDGQIVTVTLSTLVEIIDWATKVD